MIYWGFLKIYLFILVIHQVDWFSKVVHIDRILYSDCLLQSDFKIF